MVTAIQTTIPIAVNADPKVVQAALLELPTIGNDLTATRTST